MHGTYTDHGNADGEEGNLLGASKAAQPAQTFKL